MKYSELKVVTYEFYLCPGEYPVCEKVWPFLNKIIAKAVETIIPMLELYGVKDAHKSSFWSKFYFCKDILSVYVAYCIRTFLNDGVNGEKEAEGVEVDAISVDRDEGNTSLLTEHIYQFTTDIFNLYGESEGENDDVVVVENLFN